MTTLSDQLSQLTYVRKEQLWFENLADNLDTVRAGKDVLAMPHEVKPVIVLGAGPSYNVKQEEFHRIRRLAFDGKLNVFAADKTLESLLENRITPSLTASLDGDPVIAKFYSCLKQYNPVGMKICLASMVHPSVVEATKNYDRYWFNIVFDKIDGSDVSISRAVHWMTRKCLTNGLGNVGSWLSFAAVETEAKPVILIGIDFSYGVETSPMKTPYWNGFMKQYGGDTKKVIKECFHYETNSFGNRVLTDIVFDGYRGLFLEALDRMKTEVINCSPYSIVNGPRVKCMSLDEALKQV